MIKKMFLLVLFSLFSLFSQELQAYGIIIIDLPQPIKHETPRLTVKSHHVNVSINQQIATTKVEQVFTNPHNYVIEGTYIFPIPKDATISNFSMQMNQKQIEAKMYPVQQAREIYENIVRQHKDPALLEYIDYGMMQARIYPIPAHGTVKISLKYTEVLNADNGTVKYQYALGTEKGVHKPVEEIEINIANFGEPLHNFYSPTHQLSLRKPAGIDFPVLSYSEKNIIPDRDFIFYYTNSQDDIGFNVLTYHNGQQDGYFLAVASPNNDTKQPQAIVAKNIIFVLDTSGSMMGEKIEQAKNALLFCLGRLNPDDRFNIVLFNSHVSSYQTGLVHASKENIAKAQGYVKSLYADGGTDINTAMKVALGHLPADEKPNMIIVLTDGQPTVGECDITRIIHNTTGANVAKTRIFSFGVGYDVNTTLLDKMSLDNKGTSDYVAPQENIEAKVSNFYLKVSCPVLTDLSLKFAGTEVKELYPVVLPDLFFGSQLLVVGRYVHGGNVTLDLAGNHQGLEKHFLFPTHFATNDITNDFLPRIWAGRKIAHLIDQMVLEGKDNKTLVDAIVALSKKYGIITSYTAFLITDDIAPEQMIDHADKMLKHAMYDQTGQASCERAIMQKSLRESTSSYAQSDANPAVREKIRFVGTRTFYNKKGVWVDAEHTDAIPVVTIQPFSVAYFDLLKQYPDYAACFALGNNVIIKTPTYSIVIGDGDIKVPAPVCTTKCETKNAAPVCNKKHRIKRIK